MRKLIPTQVHSLFAHFLAGILTLLTVTGSVVITVAADDPAVPSNDDPQLQSELEILRQDMKVTLTKELA